MTKGLPALFTPAVRVDDLARAWRAVDQMRAIGGDAAWLGAMIAERLGKRPDYRAARLHHRDAAILALAQLYPPAKSVRALTPTIERAVSVYAATRWESERGRGAAPAIHGPAGAALFNIMAASGGRGPPGEKTIRNALGAAGLGKTIGAPFSQKQAQDFPQLQLNRSDPAVNATPSQAEVLAALARHPSATKIAAEESAKKVAARESLVARRRQIETASVTEWLKDVRAEEAAIAAVRAAEDALREANRKLGAANIARAAGAHTRRFEIERIDAELAAGADEASIRAFHDELYLALADAMRHGALVSVADVRRSEVTGKLVGRSRSNTASVQAHIAAVTEALRGIDLLRLEPDQSRLADRFAEIRAAIPAIDVNPQMEASAR